MPPVTTSIHVSLEVNAPVDAVYERWSRFEEFPQFMENVMEVRRRGERMLVWRVAVDGRIREWTAKILQTTPSERIEWHAEHGHPSAGAVALQAVGPNRTKVTLTVDYLARADGDGSRLDPQRASDEAEENLRQFRRMIEEERGQRGLH